MRLRASFGSIRFMDSTAAFVLWVTPVRASRLLDRFSSDPKDEQITTPGPHPGRVICPDVVPFGVEHPQVERLDAARARRGFVGSIVCSEETHSPDDRAMRMPALPVECATGSRANGASLRST